MQSFIVVHKEKEKRDDYLRNFFTTHTISPFDRRTITAETSLGIEDIREMQKHLYLMPAKGTQKAIILENAQTLTTEAQNALLKVLEEPPTHTFFFLATTTIDAFLQTILSRCSLVTLTQEETMPSTEEIALLEEDFMCLFSEKIADKLFLAEKIANQKELIPTWLSTAIQYIRSKMLNDVAHNAHLAPLLTKLQDAYRIITTTNTNARITLEHTFLS